MAESRSEKKNEEDAQERISMLCEPMYKTLKANSTNKAVTQIKEDERQTRKTTRTDRIPLGALSVCLIRRRILFVASPWTIQTSVLTKLLTLLLRLWVGDQKEAREKLQDLR
jgi:hypothetical protein